MTQDPLLPCPFCGSSETEIREGQTHDTWLARCDNCGCKTMTTYTAKECTEVWNTRAALAAPQPRGCICQDQHRRGYCTEPGCPYATQQPAPDDEGIDFALLQLCAFLGVDPQSVTWDAATETRDGDVQAVIGNIMRAKFGEDWGPDAVPQPASLGRETANWRPVADALNRVLMAFDYDFNIIFLRQLAETAILASTTAPSVDRKHVNTLLDTIENAYHFECEAGPLRNCGEWKALKRALAGTKEGGKS